MGVYLNPGNDAFRESINSEIYVDKSKLIAYTNKVMETERKYLCVSRPRRFGKSMAAKMLAAYYDKTCDSHAMFRNLGIASDPSYGQHINRSSVLYLDISWFRATAGNGERVVEVLQREAVRELRAVFPDSVGDSDTSLPLVLANIYKEIGEKFIIIIDEWDFCYMQQFTEIWMLWQKE